MSKAQGIAQSANQGQFKNRIINGAMMIDQRNAGANVALTGALYTLDRWQTQAAAASKLTAQQSSVAPAGFVNSLLFTVVGTATLGSTDTYRLIHKIEGLNVADLGWGTANAQPITLSFRVRSSVTGTYGASIQNSNNDRSYPFTYTIDSANTWETKTVTIAGDTTGTWLTTNGVGLYLMWGLGVGSSLSGTAGAWASADYRSATGATSLVATNGATFYITGVQLEKGSTATSFDYRPYGTELALCQRYYEKSYNIDVAPGTNTLGGVLITYVQLNASSCTGGGLMGRFAVTKRVNPTVTAYTVSGTAGSITDDNSGTSRTATVDLIGNAGFRIYCSTPAQAALNLTGHFTASAEL